MKEDWVDEVEAAVTVCEGGGDQNQVPKGAIFFEYALVHEEGTSHNAVRG